MDENGCFLKRFNQSERNEGIIYSDVGEVKRTNQNWRNQCSSCGGLSSSPPDEYPLLSPTVRSAGLRTHRNCPLPKKAISSKVMPLLWEAHMYQQVLRERKVPSCPPQESSFSWNLRAEVTLSLHRRVTFLSVCSCFLPSQQLFFLTRNIPLRVHFPGNRSKTPTSC